MDYKTIKSDHKIEYIFPDIYYKYIKIIKKIQKPLLGKNIISNSIVDMYNKQLIKIAEVSIPNILIKRNQ